jgi:general secretion pathway protein H
MSSRDADIALRGQEAGMNGRAQMQGEPLMAANGAACSTRAVRSVNRRSRSLSIARHTARAARGFTLIEMVAVIVLIGIIASVVAFSFSKSLSAAKVQAASRDLVAALRYTRGQAIVKGEQKVLTLDIEKNSYQAPGRGSVDLPKEMVMRLTTAQQELTSETAGGIRFFPDGSSTGGNIAIVMGEREWRINIGWLTGEITLDKPEDTR